MTPPRPDSFQTLGHYLDLCRFFGWEDAAAVLERRIAAAPKGDKARCLTPHAAMVEALFTAQVKASAARLPPPEPEEQPPEDPPA